MTHHCHCSEWFSRPSHLFLPRSGHPHQHYLTHSLSLMHALTVDTQVSFFCKLSLRVSQLGRRLVVNGLITHEVQRVTALNANPTTSMAAIFRLCPYPASTPLPLFIRLCSNQHIPVLNNLCALRTQIVPAPLVVLPPAIEASDLVVTEITMSSNPRDIRSTAASSHPRQSLD